MIEFSGKEEEAKRRDVLINTSQAVSPKSNEASKLKRDGYSFTRNFVFIANVNEKNHSHLKDYLALLR